MNQTQREIAKLIKHYGELIPDQFILGLSDLFERETKKWDECPECGTQKQYVFNPQEFKKIAMGDSE